MRVDPVKAFVLHFFLGAKTDARDGHLEHGKKEEQEPRDFDDPASTQEVQLVHDFGRITVIFLGVFVTLREGGTDGLKEIEGCVSGQNTHLLLVGIRIFPMFWLAIVSGRVRSTALVMSKSPIWMADSCVSLRWVFISLL